MIARLGFAALFLVLLPGILALWAWRLDRWMPLSVPLSPSWGWMGVAAGVGLMLSATGALWRHGGGLPMSAFPPPRAVRQGVYRWFANPLYVGAVLVALGFSIGVRSPAGTWIIVPVLALLATAYVVGFEAEHTRARFGALPRPALRLPENDARSPSAWERWAVVVRVLLPWLVAYLSVEWIGAPPDAIAVPRLPGEVEWPVLPWSELAYALTYLAVAVAPFVAHEARALRRFAVHALTATALVIPIYLVFPLVVEAKAVPLDPTAPAWLLQLLRWERLGESPVTAHPSFHVIWMLLTAELFAARWPRARWLWTLASVAVAVACVTTGMHAVLDVVAGVLVWLVVRRADAVWAACCRWAEWCANSWRERRVGSVRFLSHGVWAAAGGAGGATLASVLAGGSTAWWATAATVAGIVGAALWGQLVEGSAQLMRPFGFFGAALGVLLTCVIALAVGADGWLLLAAMSVGGHLTLALGRGRCLVQGCCHGRPIGHGVGIRHAHPRSRVVRLSAYGGVPLHPTALYSMLWALACGVLLLRLWSLSAPLPFIAGMAWVLQGVGRFAEEHYRGEPQTRVVAGLRLYQWLALGMVVVGVALSMASGASAPTPSTLHGSVLAALGGLLVFTYIAYGVDFPDSNARFSRLV